MLSIVIAVVGLSFSSFSALAILSTTSIPSITWPKTGCLPSRLGFPLLYRLSMIFFGYLACREFSRGIGRVLVDEELAAIGVWLTSISHRKSTTDVIEIRSNLVLETSSLIFVLSLSCQMDWPPVPSPFGSPVWTMKPSMTRWKVMPL